MTNETNTDLRQERGRILSNDKRIKRIAGMTWLVPSQTQNAGGYVVNTAEKTCTCPDFELRRCKCKHAIGRSSSSRPSKRTPTASTTVTESLSYSRTTHSQDWTAYNASPDLPERRTSSRRFCAASAKA
jgi:hypothetical protein